MGNGFLTFDMYKFGKIRRHHWKERLEISLKVMRLKRAKVKLRKATKSYRSVCGGGVGGGGGGGKFVPPHCGPQTSVKFRDFEEVYLR